MKALSVRQPEAWLICNGFKDVENRTWSTSHRGPLLIHAGKTRMTGDDWQWLRDLCAANDRPVPARHEIRYGGIIGIANLTDCVNEDKSEWFDGPFGWILTDTARLPFHSCPGRLGLFDVPGYDVDVDGDTLTIPA